MESQTNNIKMKYQCRLKPSTKFLTTASCDNSKQNTKSIFNKDCAGCLGPLLIEKEKDDEICQDVCGDNAQNSKKAGLCIECKAKDKPTKPQKEKRKLSPVLIPCKIDTCAKMINPGGKTGMCLSCFNKETAKKKLEEKEKFFCEKCGNPRSYGSTNLCRNCYETKPKKNKYNKENIEILIKKKLKLEEQKEIIDLNINKIEKQAEGYQLSILALQKGKKNGKKAVEVIDEVLKPEEKQTDLINIREPQIKYLKKIREEYKQEAQQQADIENIAKIRKEWLVVTIDHIGSLLYSIEELSGFDKGNNHALCDWCERDESRGSDFEIFCSDCQPEEKNKTRGGC